MDKYCQFGLSLDFGLNFRFFQCLVQKHVQKHVQCLVQTRSNTFGRVASSILPRVPIGFKLHTHLYRHRADVCAKIQEKARIIYCDTAAAAGWILHIQLVSIVRDTSLSGASSILPRVKYSHKMHERFLLTSCGCVCQHVREGAYYLL